MMSDPRKHEPLPDDLFRNRIAAALAQLDDQETDADLDAALDSVEAEPISSAAASRIMDQVRHSIAATTPSTIVRQVDRFQVSPVAMHRGPNNTRPGAANSAAAITVACVALLAVVAVAFSRVGSVPNNLTAEGGRSPKKPLSNQLIGMAEPIPPMNASFVAQRVEIGQTLTTGPREKRRVTLPDGSVLSINEQSTVTVISGRRLKLLAGEVFVEVIPAAVSDGVESTTKSERFVVETSKRQVTALGTKFVVKAAGEATNVVVMQGKVQVSGVKDVIEAGHELIADQTDSNSVELRPARRSAYVVEWVKDLMAAAGALVVPTSEHAGGTITVVDPQGQSIKLSLRRFHVDVHIEDGFARTTIDQTYFNHTWQQLEGTFRFPLPADASLSRLAMYVNGTLMEGGMVERDYGRNVFEQIRHTRRDPALLEWVDGSTFQMRVFPLEARQEKRILLSYTQRLPSDYGKSVYRFPAGHNLEGVRNWSTHVRVKDASATKWYSPSHLLDGRVEQGDLLIEGREDYAALDRDLVLELSDEPLGAKPNSSPVWSKFEQDGFQYLMLRWRPEMNTNATRSRRHWILLVENSADRNAIIAETQRQIAKVLLDNFEHTDTISVIRAGTQPDLFQNKPVDCSLDHMAAAVQFLKQVAPIGALDLSQALQAVQSQMADSRETWIVHLGTGIPVLGERDQTTLLRQLPAKARYVGVAVGKRWSKSFMETAAKQTGGHVVQINPDEAVAWRAFDLLSTLNAPRLTEIAIASEVKNGLADAVKAETAAFLPLTAGLSHGQEFAAVTRVAIGQALPNSIVVSGKVNGDAFSQTIAIPEGLSSQTAEVPGVSTARHTAVVKSGHLPRTWARLEIDRLVSLGSVENKAQIIDLSKSMYVMSPFTSLLVLETEAMYEQFKVDRGRKDHWAMYDAPATIPVNAEPGPAQLSVLDAAKERLKLAESRVKTAESNLARSIADKRPAADLSRLERVKQAELADVKLLTLEIQRIEKANEAAADPVRKAWESVIQRRVLWQYRYGPQYTNYWHYWGRQPGFQTFGEGFGGGLRGAGGFGNWAPPDDHRARLLSSTLREDLEFRTFRDALSGRRWRQPSALIYLNDGAEDDVRDFFSAPNQKQLRQILPFTGDSTRWSDQNSLMLMTSPRIIIQEGEESLLNFVDSPQAGFGGFINGTLGGSGLGRGFGLKGIPGQVPFGWAVTDLEQDEAFIFRAMPSLTAMPGGRTAHWVTPRGEALFDDALSQNVLSHLDAAFIPAEGINRDYLWAKRSRLAELMPLSLSHSPVEVWKALTERRRQWADVDLRRDSPREQRIREELKQLTEVRFQDISLKDALDYLEDLHKIEIWLDAKALSDESISAETKVTLQATGVSLNSVLQSLLRPLSLTFIIEDEVLKVSTKSAADRTIAGRIYPVSDLFQMQGSHPITGFAWDGKPYNTSIAYPITSLLQDLPSYAPGLQTWAADRFAAADQAARNRPATGIVDPEARRLIEKARSTGWEQVWIPSTDKGHKDRRENAAIVADGSGRFRIDREVSEGLKETVINDGSTMWHLYSELGLGAKRAVSRFHQMGIQRLVPWYVPTVDELSSSGNLSAVGERTVRITAINQPASTTANQVELVFGQEGGLSELRVIDGTSHNPLFRQTFSTDGTVRLLDAKDKLIAEARYDRRRTDAPSLVPTTTDLVVLPLPYRSSASLSVNVPMILQNSAPDYAMLSDDDALALLATYFAEARQAELVNLLDQRFTSRGDHRIGLAVLLSSVMPENALVANATKQHPDLPLAKYLEQFAAWTNIGQLRGKLDAGEHAPLFLKRICEAGNYHERWAVQTDLTRDRSLAEIEQDLTQALTYVRECRSLELALRLLSTIQSGLKQHNRLLPNFAVQLNATATAIAIERDIPAFARQSRIEWLLLISDDNSLASAKDLFREGLTESIEQGVVPVLHTEVRTAFCQRLKTPDGQSCGAWADLVRDAARNLATRNQALALVAVARRCVALGESTLGAEVVQMGIKDQNLAVKLQLNLAAMEYAKEAQDWVLAEACVQRALSDPQSKPDSTLWRDAARIAHNRQKFHDWIENLEKAYELEFAALPKTVDLEKFRQDYDSLFKQLEQRTDQLVDANREDQDAFSKVIQRAATRWREIDSDDTSVCHRAAKMLTKLGQASAAWNYWTTPLAESPDQSSAWTAFATAMDGEHRFNIADKSWSTAFACEPTNPEILLQHAQFLRNTKQEVRARALLTTITTSNWQPRFEPTKAQAQAMLTGQ